MKSRVRLGSSWLQGGCQWQLGLQASTSSKREKEKDTERERERERDSHVHNVSLAVRSHYANTSHITVESQTVARAG